MADNFGLKIGLEGEKEFKNALRDINQSFKVLCSKMNLVSSQFDKQDKSIQAITARNAVLNKEIDAQKDKISTLESALKNAADSFGENDRRAQNWAVQLNNAKAELNGMEKELEQEEMKLNIIKHAKYIIKTNGPQSTPELYDDGLMEFIIHHQGLETRDFSHE